MKNVLICDDHPILRQALAISIINEWPDANIFEAESFNQAIDIAAKDFCVALIDLNMPGGDPYNSILQIMQLNPKMPILVITGIEDNELMLRLINAGIAGFVSKAQAGKIIIAAINLVLAGGRYLPESLMQYAKKTDTPPENFAAANTNILTPRQIEIVKLVAIGKSNKEIARILNISHTTIQTHLANIYDCLGVNNRTEAVHKAGESGLLV